MTSRNQRNEEPMIEFVQAMEDFGRFKQPSAEQEEEEQPPRFIAQASDTTGRFRAAPPPMINFAQATENTGRFKPNNISSTSDIHIDFIPQARDDFGRFRINNNMHDDDDDDDDENEELPSFSEVNDCNDDDDNNHSNDDDDSDDQQTKTQNPPKNEISQRSKIEYMLSFLSCCTAGGGNGGSRNDTNDNENHLDYSKMTNKELGLLGVSIHCLSTKFMDCVNATPGLDEASKIYEIENLHQDDDDGMGVIRTQSVNTKCPMDGQMGSAYVHTHTHKDLVGPATIMLSYTWGYQIGQIIDTLQHFCTSNHNLDPKRTYVWICCLCVNQHRVVEKKKRKEDISFDVFQKTFYDRVTSIGHILAMMAPWTAPTYLTRAWCVFELFTANSNGCQITIEMPSTERENFIKGITNDDNDIDDHVNKLFDTLSNTSVANASASVPVDLENILKLIQDGIGYKAFDVVINTLLREWVIQLIHDTVKSRTNAFVGGKGEKWNEDHVKFLNQVGTLYANIGEYDSALSAFEPILQHNEKINGSDHSSVSVVLNNIALVYEHQGKFEAAMKKYNRALKIDEQNKGKFHVDTALTLTNMAGAVWRQEKYDDALKLLDRALAIQEEMLGDHINTANTLNTIGIILNRQEDYEKAYEIHCRVLKMKEGLLGIDHTSTANTLNNMGLVLKNQAKYDEALGHYKRGLAVYEKVLGVDHPNTVRTQQNIELVMRLQSRNS